MAALVVTLVGPDRSGLVGVVSDVVRRHDGNWLESRMAHLAGQFAGIVLLEVAQENTVALSSALQQLSSHGLKVVVEVDSATGSVDAGGRLLTMNLVANDRPGIIREVTSALASHDVNVEELTTECVEAPQAGGRIFKANAQLRLPDGLSIELLQNELEGLATDLMIDFSTAEDGNHCAASAT